MSLPLGAALKTWDKLPTLGLGIFDCRFSMEGNRQSAIQNLHAALPLAGKTSMTDEQPLRSVHTNTFPALLEELNISLLVTTYQAGKLVALRADNGVLNTHFRSFSKPMGLA